MHVVENQHACHFISSSPRSVSEDKLNSQEKIAQSCCQAMLATAQTDKPIKNHTSANYAAFLGPDLLPRCLMTEMLQSGTVKEEEWS